MTALEMEHWLTTEESRDVGRKGENGKSEDVESVGHRSGRRIVEILRRKKAELTEEDFAHMRTVTGYIRRHLAQRPEGDVSATNWAYSLKNWGHDPAKGDA